MVSKTRIRINFKNNLSTVGLPRDCEVKSFSFDNFKFVMLDENAALLTYTAMQDAVCNGETIPAKVRASVNYVKRGGKWLEAFYMETPITQ